MATAKTATDNPTLTREEAASFVGLAVATMDRHRYEGNGAPYMKIGARVLYRKAALTQWLDAMTVDTFSLTEDA